MTEILSIETRGNIRIVTTLRDGANKKVGKSKRLVCTVSVIAIPAKKPRTKIGVAIRNAALTGKTVCSVCPLKAACYAQHGQETSAALPSSLQSLVRHGKNPWKMDDFQLSRKAVLSLVRGRKVRLTSVGDPSDIPKQVLSALVAGEKLAYTHAWKTNRNLRKHAMASVETAKSALIAQRLGWRTFRARAVDSPLLEGEIDCRSGEGLTCVECGLCAGLSVDGPNVSIVVHGIRKNKLPKQ